MLYLSTFTWFLAEDSNAADCTPTNCSSLAAPRYLMFQCDSNKHMDSLGVTTDCTIRPDFFLTCFFSSYNDSYYYESIHNRAAAIGKAFRAMSMV